MVLACPFLIRSLFSYHPEASHFSYAVMPQLSTALRKKHYRQLNYRLACILPGLHKHPSHVNFCHLRAKIQFISASLDSLEISPTYTLQSRCIKGVAVENQGKLYDEDDDLCPVDCVREFKTDEEFLNIIEKAKETNSLVVVDFYRTSCGSCKYIEQGFSKLCKGAGDEDTDVIFLKHNVLDEYDEQSEVAERLRIRAVPLFHFYKNGVLLEAFPTRDKERIIEAIKRYTSTNQDA